MKGKTGMLGKAYGVVIGVENYSISGMSPVLCAHADAKAFADAITDNLGVPKANVSLWLDDAATRTNLEIELPLIVDKLNEEDRFYFYYAGHGLYCAGANRLTAWDTHPQHLHETTVDLEAILLKPLRSSPCKSSLVFVDACADKIVDLATSSRDITSDMDEKQFREFVQNVEHVAAFFACSKGEKSHSFKSLGHGIWSYHLLHALKGLEPKAAKKGFVTGHSLSNFLKLSIPQYIRENTKITKHQTPYGLVGSSGDFLIREMPRAESATADLTVISPDFSAAHFEAIETRSFQNLPGFNKARKHTVPDSVNGSADHWAQRLLAEEVEEELQTIYDNAKRILNLRRREVKLSSETGEGSVDTEQFRFEVLSGQSTGDPSEVYLRREVVLRVLPSALPDDFDDIFPEPVDCVVVPFDAPEGFYDELADALEEIEFSGGGRFEEDKSSKALTLTLSAGATLFFDTLNRTMTITPPAASGCLGVLEALSRNSLAKLLGSGSLNIGAR